MQGARKYLPRFAQKSQHHPSKQILLCISCFQAPLCELKEFDMSRKLFFFFPINIFFLSIKPGKMENFHERSCARVAAGNWVVQWMGKKEMSFDLKNLVFWGGNSKKYHEMVHLQDSTTMTAGSVSPGFPHHRNVPWMDQVHLFNHG